MTVALLVAAGLTAWTAVAYAVARVLGRVVEQRNRQTPHHPTDRQEDPTP